MKLLIDGDIVAYRAGFASEKTKYLVEHENRVVAQVDNAADAKTIAEGRTIWSRKEVEPVSTALMIADSMIKDIKARYENDSPVVCVYLTGSGNFRNGIATRATYKGNRASAVPPVHIRAIREHLVAKWDAVYSVGEEADDRLGIAMTANPGSVCCSIDKDLMQIPGKHYNFVTKEEVTVSPKDGCLNLYAQVLSGDATDNIPGLTGIGPVKAAKALEKAQDALACWRLCVDAYITEFGLVGRAYALEALQLVHVRRREGQIISPPELSNGTSEETVAAATPVHVKAKVSRASRVPKRTGARDSSGLASQGSQV